MPLRYEDLTSDPETHLRALLAFLGEPWVPQILRFHAHDHDHWVGLQDSKAADSRAIERRSGTWRKRSPDERDRMLRQAGPMLERLGYGVESGGG
jgi:hypothetical protein